MSEPGAKAPSPYKFCEAHFVPNCVICAEARPNPISGDPMPVPELPTSPSGNPELAKSAPLAPPLPPQPKFTDPTALAVTEAAQRFARAREAVADIEAQLSRVLEAIDVLRKKDCEARIEQAEASKVLSEALTGVNDAK